MIDVTRNASATLLAALLSPYGDHLPPKTDLDNPEHRAQLTLAVLLLVGQEVYLTTNSLASLHGSCEHTQALHRWARVAEMVAEEGLGVT